jgi:hypothetical protein
MTRSMVPPCHQACSRPECCLRTNGYGRHGTAFVTLRFAPSRSVYYCGMLRHLRLAKRQRWVRDAEIAGLRHGGRAAIAAKLSMTMGQKARRQIGLEQAVLAQSRPQKDPFADARFDSTKGAGQSERVYPWPTASPSLATASGARMRNQGGHLRVQLRTYPPSEMSRDGHAEQMCPSFSDGASAKCVLRGRTGGQTPPSSLRGRSLEC